MRKEQKRKIQKSGLGRAVRALRRTGAEIPTDVLGSYTGTALMGGRPVQDADDL